jgi:hypothetical protein
VYVNGDYRVAKTPNEHEKNSAPHEKQSLSGTVFCGNSGTLTLSSDVRRI